MTKDPSVSATPVAEPVAGLPAQDAQIPQAEAAQGPAPAAEAAPAAANPAQPPPKPAFPPASSTLTQIGPEGISYDFNEGCRVMLPPRTDGQWRVILRDLDTDSILFHSENKGAFVRSSKQWYVRFGVEVWELIDGKEPRLVMEHKHDVADRNIMIMFPIGTLGDILAWFPYAARFAEKHPKARVTCALSPLIIPLLADTYPNLRLVNHDEVKEEKLTETAYSTYYLGLFFDDKANDHQPTDFRMVGLHRTAAYILGVDTSEEVPKLAIPDGDTRPIEEPYAIIAVQSSSGCKYWNNPTGWTDVVRFLKERGYRVICIDQKPVHGFGLMWTHIPHDAEDQTGDRPLTERARWLKHASLFVGLSSGLGWLAWAAGTPTVLISGFTHPTNEFSTPYRVINWHVCNSCWNDQTIRFNHHDFLWCPRHQNTPRHFECTRLISSKQVTQTIEMIPGLLPAPASA